MVCDFGYFHVIWILQLSRRWRTIFINSTVEKPKSCPFGCCPSQMKYYTKSHLEYFNRSVKPHRTFLCAAKGAEVSVLWQWSLCLGYLSKYMPFPVFPMMCNFSDYFWCLIQHIDVCYYLTESEGKDYSKELRYTLPNMRLQC